ncbi:MAG: T9SS type A sorting domain-containing protein, partial [Saprospiraceae bacterium]|nr:T9SS type A sorting domain-containing protein [Saprospiraceae bacterium]
HTGTFLPKGLLSTTGWKDDYSVTETCRRLAKMGYVAVAMEYRLGWNAASMQELERRAQIIQAAYRSVQDVYTFIRFANLLAQDQGNPFGFDTDRIALYGIGTGGFVSVNAAVIDNLAEAQIPKFQNPITAEYFITQENFGDITGEDPGIFVVGQDTFPFNIPNHVGYSNDFHFCFSADGGLGDSSWIEGDQSVPIVLAGVVDHPTTPFGVDMMGNTECDVLVRNGLTGDPIIPIAPTKCVAEKANDSGINDILNDATFNDPVSQAIRDLQYAEEHLWPIHLPGQQTGPWAYWDSSFWKNVPHPFIPNTSLHKAELATNPDMSMEKANRYIDTLIAFFAPRACIAMNLGCTETSTDQINPDVIEMRVVPNPATDYVSISVGTDYEMESVTIRTIEGRVIHNQRINAKTYRFNISQLPTGTYFANVITKDGVASRAFLVE